MPVILGTIPLPHHRAIPLAFRFIRSILPRNRLASELVSEEIWCSEWFETLFLPCLMRLASPLRPLICSHYQATHSLAMGVHEQEGFGRRTHWNGLPRRGARRHDRLVSYFWKASNHHGRAGSALLHKPILRSRFQLVHARKPRHEDHGSCDSSLECNGRLSPVRLVD